MTRVATSLLRAAGDLAQPAGLKVMAKSEALTLALFALLGWGGSYAMEAGLDALGLDPAGRWGIVLAALLTIVAMWLLFRIVALAVLQFFADEVVAAVERRAYPAAAARARKLGLTEEIRVGLGGALRALAVNLLALPFALALTVTGVGTALLFWAVNAWLLGRELSDMVWLRHRTAPDAPVPGAGAERFLLGGMVAALLVVPFVNFVAPVLGAAAATHLVHLRMRPARAV
jgi:uncharacterized protein involved in cysteine biosynthesis